MYQEKSAAGSDWQEETEIEKMPLEEEWDGKQERVSLGWDAMM